MGSEASFFHIGYFLQQCVDLSLFFNSWAFLPARQFAVGLSPRPRGERISMIFDIKPLGVPSSVVIWEGDIQIYSFAILLQFKAGPFSYL